MAYSLGVIDEPQRAAAKVAGLAYLISFAVIVYANFGLRVPLMTVGAPGAAMRNIASAERLYRISVTLDLLYCVVQVALVAALYVVLKPVSRHLALLASLWRFVYILASVMMALNFLTVLRFSGGADYQRLIGAEPLQALMRLSSGARNDLYYVGLVFTSLASTVCAWLFVKSRYIPAALAKVGVATSVWCAICAVTYIVNPGITKVVNLWWFDSPMALFDIATSVWFLTKGLPKAPPAMPEPA